MYCYFLSLDMDGWLPHLRSAYPHAYPVRMRILRSRLPALPAPPHPLMRVAAATSASPHRPGSTRLYGRFLIRLSGFSHLGNRYAPENFEHMAEKISPRYVEIRGLFGFRCT